MEVSAREGKRVVTARRGSLKARSRADRWGGLVGRPRRLRAAPGRQLHRPMRPCARPRRGGVVRSRLRLRTKVRDCRLSRRWRAAATYIYVLRRGLRSRRAVSGQPAPRESRLRRRAGRLQARASPRRGGSARRGGRTTTGGRLAGRGAPGCRPRQTRAASDCTENTGGWRQGAANAGLRPPACIAIS